MEKKPQLIYINSDSSRIKRFNLSYKKICLVVLSLIAITAFMFKYSVDIISDFSQNTKISQLKEENALLQSELSAITQKITTIRQSINLLEEKDDQIRSMLDLPPINSDVRQVGIGGAGSKVNDPVNLSQLSFGEELVESNSLLKKLEREIRLEKISYQKLLTTVERRQDSVKYLPILKPVQNAYISSSFGRRRHPIWGKMHYHRGVDLATNKGTPIIAPSDGYVVYAGRNAGYGLFIQINHKYGFETYYGHLNKIYVRKGQFVKRGDKIGEVGSSGISTSSHLHYEVHYNGNALNPTQFFLNDIEY